MAPKLVITGSIPLTGNLREDAQLTIDIAVRVEALQAGVAACGGSITIEQVNEAAAEVKPPRWGRPRKVVGEEEARHER